MSPAAKSLDVTVTGISTKEGSQFYEVAIATKSMHGIATTLCHKGESLSDTNKPFTMPAHISMSQLVA